MRRYKVIRADRASRQIFAEGDIVYPGNDCYGCAGDDTRSTGIEHTAVSSDESGTPFFTIPKADIQVIN